MICSICKAPAVKGHSLCVRHLAAYERLNQHARDNFRALRSGENRPPENIPAHHSIFDPALYEYTLAGWLGVLITGGAMGLGVGFSFWMQDVILFAILTIAAFVVGILAAEPLRSKLAANRAIDAGVGTVYNIAIAGWWVMGIGYVLQSFILFMGGAFAFVIYGLWQYAAIRNDRLNDYRAGYDIPERKAFSYTWRHDPLTGTDYAIDQDGRRGHEHVHYGSEQ